MPRWARFLSCTFTGLLLSLVGFFMVAFWQEGGREFWPDLFDFFATTAFWGLVWLFGLLAALSLIVARLGVNLYGLSGGAGGFLGGIFVALIYAMFLVASHAADWGGMFAALAKVGPAAITFSAPFGIAGAVSSSLWERLG